MLSARVVTLHFVILRRVRKCEERCRGFSLLLRKEQEPTGRVGPLLHFVLSHAQRTPHKYKYSNDSTEGYEITLART